MSRSEVILQAITAACTVTLLAGCLDGNSGITSSGTDGHTESHVPVGDKGCYIIIGGGRTSDNSIHCPTQGMVP
jgi:hypothetical protein